MKQLSFWGLAFTLPMDGEVAECNDKENFFLSLKLGFGDMPTM